jgi:alpha-L-fucosidase
MKKTLIVLLVLIGQMALAQAQPETKAHYDARMKWWKEARFGMFIHWGLYSIPAGEWKGKTQYGEWIRTSAQIPLKTYDKFIDQFNPVKFNADEWVRMAKDAGMKYIVITTKHHDGYCNFYTEQTDFSVKSTPFKKDPMKDLADACRKYGVKLCFYYSIMDWHHPDYTPRRDWEKGRSAKGANFDKYVDYMKAELKEILLNYGDIGILWFDGEWESTWNNKYGREIYDYCRSIQPDIIINNRANAGRIPVDGLDGGLMGGDYGTPEQEIPATGMPGKYWETCMTMNEHWGYNSHDKNFKSTRELLRNLSDIASKGGNYLLNVGPTAEGLFPWESIERLKEIGDWMKVNGEAIYGTEANPFAATPWGRCTMKATSTGTRLYLHLFDWPADGKLTLSGCLNEPAKAFQLADTKKSPLKVTRKDDAILITLPKTAPDSLISVVVIDLKGKLDLTNPPEIACDFSTIVDSLVVTLKTNRDKVEIRYTLDGASPGLKSRVYEKPIVLKEPCTISARCFRKGKPVSGTSSRSFMKTRPLPAWDFAQNGIKAEKGLKYQYFDGAWDSIPDFSKMKPEKEGVIPNFTYEVRKQEDRFGMNYTGYIGIPRTGIYMFYLESDDGSRLKIDGNVVVDNDGLHSNVERQGSIALSQGFHIIQVEYFDRTGGDALIISVKSTVLEKEPVPSEWLCH